MGHVSCMGGITNAYALLVGKPEEKRPIGRCRCRLDDNIKINLKEIQYRDVDWIHLACNRSYCWAEIP